jgi:hypothetical protein
MGYFGTSRDDCSLAEDMEELAQKLIDILAKDHLQHSMRNGSIELDFQKVRQVS